LSAITVNKELTNGIDRESLRLAFESFNIECRPLWKPMHLQPLFEHYPYYGSNVAANLFENGLCLPSGSNLSNEDRARIKSVVNQLFKIQ
jgi:dTDP-4-amino-4,6-dideoxygalactose transaminase